MSRPGWDDYFLRIADLAGSRSTCPRCQVGAVLARDQRVIATGYNGSLRGQPHCTEAGCLMVDGHCKRTVHAELNALLQCALYGVSSRGCMLFTTTYPCLDCAKALVQAGIQRVVYRDAYPPGQPEQQTAEVLAAAGVALTAAPRPAREPPDAPTAVPPGDGPGAGDGSGDRLRRVRLPGNQRHG